MSRKYLVAVLASATVFSACLFHGTPAYAQNAAPDKAPGKVPDKAAVAAAPVAKDTIEFTNGDKLTGTLVRSQADKVTFKSDIAGEITVGWDKVKELRTGGEYAVLEKGFKQRSSRRVDDAKIPQGTVTVTQQTVSVQQGTGEPATVPVAQTDFIVDQKTYEKDVRGKPGLLQGWTGNVQAGASLVRATQNTTTFNGALALVRIVPTVSWLDPRTRSTIDYSQSYGKTTQPVADAPDITTLTSILHADAEHDIYFTPRVYVLGDAQFDHNVSQGLQLQQIYGGGIGATIVKQAKQQLDVKGQAQYEKQAYSTIPGSDAAPMADQNLIAATFAENYMRKLGKAVVLTEQVQYLPAFNQVSDYSVLAQGGIALPLFKRFNFSLSLIDNYLNDPATGAQKNSFQTITALQYTFK